VGEDRKDRRGYRSWDFLKGLGEDHLEGALGFMSRCKTEREAVRHLASALAQAGFGQDGQVTQRGTFVNLKGRAIGAYRPGRRPAREGVRIVASHGDSPRIDIKPKPLYEDKGLLMGDCHYYGGIKQYQWVNVPLELRGEVHLKDGTAVELDGSQFRLVIPDLAPHLDRNMDARKASETIKGEDLDVILGHRPGDSDVKGAVLGLLKDRYGFGEEDLVSADLALVPQGDAFLGGVDGSLLISYGLDDRICTYTSFEAFMGARDLEQGAVFLCLDREEIGSEGVGGAQGALIRLLLSYVLEAEGASGPFDLERALAASEAISADVTEAYNPMYKDAFDHNQLPVAGDGPAMMKFTGVKGKYDASESRGEFVARVRARLDGASVPWQVGSLGKVGTGGGGTVAKYLARYGMDVLDLGPAVISLHAPYEIMSAADVTATVAAYRAFYER
jgi:aspartyl aminopeptidase